MWPPKLGIVLGPRSECPCRRKKRGVIALSEELLRTPLFEEHLALGARIVPFAGYEMPVQYSGIIDEHRAVRARAGVFDVCHMAEFRVFGFGAYDFLQRMLTNDLGRIRELGQAQYTLMLDDDGGVIDDLIVYHSGDVEYLIIANASNRATDFAWLEDHVPESVELVDESDRTGLIALQGPDALRIMGELAGEAWEPPERFTVAEALIDAAVPALVAGRATRARTASRYSAEHRMPLLSGGYCCPLPR